MLVMSGNCISVQTMYLCTHSWQFQNLQAAVQSAEAEARASADTAAALQEQLEHVKIRLQEAYAAKESTAPPSKEVSRDAANIALSTKSCPQSPADVHSCCLSIAMCKQVATAWPL